MLNDAITIFTIVSVTCLVGEFIRKRGLGESSRNYYVRRFLELNNETLSQPGRMGFLAFWIILFRWVYVIFLKNKPP
jgi:hypothetical protein